MADSEGDRIRKVYSPMIEELYSLKAMSKGNIILFLGEYSLHNA
jgi:hypothetical protein